MKTIFLVMHHEYSDTTYVGAYSTLRRARNAVQRHMGERDYAAIYELQIDTDYQHSSAKEHKVK